MGFIMKKIFIVIALFVITLFVSDLKAECPQGFSPGSDIVMNPCGSSCTIIVHWCHRTNIGHPDDVMITGYDISGDCLPGCLAEDINGNQAPSTSDMMTAIIQYEGDQIGLPIPLQQLPPCDNITPGNDIQFHCFIGKCYYIYYSNFDDVRYKTCEPLVMGECHAYYRACLKQDANGFWYVNVEPMGDETINFNCTAPCFPLCND